MKKLKVVKKKAVKKAAPRHKPSVSHEPPVSHEPLVSEEPEGFVTGITPFVRFPFVLMGVFAEGIRMLTGEKPEGVATRKAKAA